MNLTDDQARVLAAALTRAEDEWTAEFDHLDNYGDGPAADSAEQAAETLAKISTLIEARHALVAAIPAMRSGS